MDIKILVPKFPLLIVSSPRTGSNPLGYNLSARSGIRFFSLRLMERTLQNAEQESSTFIKFREHTDQYIVKVHAHQYDLFNQAIQLDHSAMTLCRIRRRNIIGQIASMYLANVRKIWAYSRKSAEYEQLCLQDIIIDIDKLKHFSDVILDANQQLDTFDVKYDITFDYDLWYEDMIFGDTTVVTPYPSNYQELKNEVKNIINNYK